MQLGQPASILGIAEDALVDDPRIANIKVNGADLTPISTVEMLSHES